MAPAHRTGHMGHSADTAGRLAVKQFVFELSEDVLLQRSLIGVIACHSLDKAKR